MEDARPVQYGKRKLGEKAWKKQQAMNKLSTRQATVYGPRKRGRMVLPDEEPAKAPAKPAAQENPFEDARGQRVTIARLEQILAEKPELLDLAIETEVSHPDGARKGALEALSDLEGRRPGGPRESVTKLLDAAL